MMAAVGWRMSFSDHESVQWIAPVAENLKHHSYPFIVESVLFGGSARAGRHSGALQHEIVTRQFEATTQQRRHCGQCGTKRAIKDFHGARFWSLFGDVELRVP